MKVASHEMPGKHVVRLPSSSPAMSNTVEPANNSPTAPNCEPLTRLPLNHRTGPSQAAAENDQENVVTNLDPAGTVSFVERDSDSSC